MTREKIEFTVSPGVILIFSVAFFFDTSGYTSALIPAVLIHELGHAAAITLLGGRIRGVRVSVLGFCMDYTGILSRCGEAVSVLAGPIAGAMYAYFAYHGGGTFFQMSGMISAVLTCFNLLPVYPLDGGRLLSLAAGTETAGICSRAAALCIAALSGAVLMLYGSPMLLPVSLWLVRYNFCLRTE